MYIFPHFSIFENEVFYSHWHVKIIVSCEIIVTAYTSVKSIMNPAGMTGQLQPIEGSVNIPCRHHLGKRWPFLGCLLTPSVSHVF